MQEKVRTAMVGCGKVGHLHAQALRNLPESQFVAVCDNDLSRAKAFADQYGVKAYTNVQEMIAATKAEAVMVCTPHPLHAALAVQAFEAGAHVLVEKAMASSLKDCDAMINASKKAQKKLGIVSQRRLYLPCQRMRQTIDTGKIGKPVLGMVVMFGWRDEAYYRSDPWRGKWKTEGGGVLVNQSPHQLDLLQWFMGPIDELYGNWANLNHPYIEVEDTALALIRFKSGGVATLLVSNSQKPGIYTKVHIHGSNGASIGVQTDGGSPFIAGMTSITEPPYNDIWSVPGEEDLLKGWQEQDRAFFQSVDAMSHYHALQVQDFLQAILTNRDPLVTGEAGRVTVEIFTAIYRSQRDRAPIKFPVPAEDGHDDFDGRTVR